MRRHLSFWLLPLVAALTACAGQPPLPGTKVGRPYMVGYHIYYPSYDEDYDKVGQASWYGPGFDGKQTASGETFDQDDLTAASPTLPMPSLVRVTNLRNGRTLIVRINDRGPFAANRIIDLSKRAAHDLGIRSVAQVRVQFLKAETGDFIARSKAAGHPVDMAFYNNPEAPIMQMAMNQPSAPPQAVEDSQDDQAQADQSQDDQDDQDDQAAADQPQGNQQIVESEVHESHADDTVSATAPVMTVSSSNLKSATNLADRHGHTVRSSGLIHQALADDNVAQEPPTARVIPAAAETPADDQEAASEEISGDVPAESARHSATRKIAVGRDLVVQAGAFSTYANARKLATRLNGIAALIVDNIKAEGRQLWRVRLGPFSDESEAAGVLAKVRSLGISGAEIMRQ